ncbi:MAG: ammonia-forming cytochrome c nitrite reductase subunit c552 [Deltaproteobacteria bacterium]|nr:ammonia-forming cytochrome c nitrite reductase subunit c552 [Deltaproteobacteria bacterium]
MKRKLGFIVVISIVVGVGFVSITRCGNTRGGVAGVASPDNCFGCHSYNSDTGYKIKWAQWGYDESVHRNGLHATIWSDAATPEILGYEWEGSDAFYANGGSASSGNACQTCHTSEGFIKKVTGQYDSRREELLDTITNPNPPHCWTCHNPHTSGDFTLRVADGTPVTLETSSTVTYSKSKGNLCASCHHARIGGTTQTDTTDSTPHGSSNEYIRASLSSGINAGHWGPHVSPQADMLMGVGGSEFSGYSYSSSVHKDLDGANCVACHMTTPSTGSFSLSPNVGGHSFNMKGIVHGAEKINIQGCKTSGCHDGGGVSSKINVAAKVVASAFYNNSSSSLYSLTANGFLLLGDAYVAKNHSYTTTEAAPTFSSTYCTNGSTCLDTNQVAFKINTLLKTLANPDASTKCDGLLKRAAEITDAGDTGNSNGKNDVGKLSIVWSKTPGDVTTPRCYWNGFDVNTSGGNIGIAKKLKVKNATNLSSNSGKIAQALFNYKFVYEADKSFGIHNTKYALQLLIDSCETLRTMSGVGGANDTATPATDYGNYDCHTSWRPSVP